MSKVKYPDREKIRKQIDIILDKSDLFKDSQDKTIHESNKIVELKPVGQGVNFPGLTIAVTEAKGTKCPRCWMHSESPDEHSLCPRCAAVCKALGVVFE